LPLDNRKDYTKLDWEIWTATLADSKTEFEQLVAPVYRFANESPSRVPLTDWYDTVTGQQQGFQARSVVGGVFVRMLADPAMWKKYAGAAGRRTFSVRACAYSCADWTRRLRNAPGMLSTHKPTAPSRCPRRSTTRHGSVFASTQTLTFCFVTLTRT
jgi:hypothetical protein